ncbi:MAG TPA: hypothetical protein PLA94_30435, partial [Myxococcota bacterium]|nr:hypothetical protein [Myxococcota bacterium]
KPLTDDLVLAGYGQYTVGITDLSVFVGGLRSDFVVGVGTATSVGPVGLHAEATLTRPPEDPLFVRAVGGAMWRPGSTTTLTGELYFQSLGAAKPEGYLEILGGERAARGELWSAGQLYAAVAGVQEITPILHANLAVIGNLRDPSALLSAGLGWSVADNAELALGGYAGLGKAPDRVEMDLALGENGVELVPPTEAELANSVNSEFGLYPAMVFVQGRMYF